MIVKKLILRTALTLVAFAALAVINVGAVSGQSAPGESNLGFLLAGVGAAWLGFFAYVFYVDRKNRDLRREIEDLRRAIDDKKGGK